MNDELEFLPAALEIQETPPLSLSRYILWSIMVFFCLALIWAVIGQVDIVGVAQGKIVPSGRIKTVQPVETGVVRSLRVSEGDLVHEGQPLVELDATLTGADREQLAEQQLTLRLEQERLLALLEYLTTADSDIRDPQALNRPLEDRFHVLSQATDIQIARQVERMQSQIRDHEARTGALQDEQWQRQAEHAAVRQRILQLEETLPLITEQAASIAELLQKGMAARNQWLELERERIEQVRELEVQKNNLLMLEASSAGIEQRIASLRAEFESQLRSELAQTEDRLRGIDQELVKAEKRLTLQTLAAPVAGRVHQMTVHTIGGVVTPAQTLMHIVPADEAIEIEAWLPNKDIGFVQTGQEAVIKVETFPFTRYGTIAGEITHVSNDATPDEKLGLVYAVRANMRSTTVPVDGKIVNLSPGMAVTVEVKMGKRRVIEYLMSPLLRYKDESIRER
ncbi:MAG: HlyD family type I secretion periplasmic adaptor subunit [Gammaproteobacteria bacterium]|nr:MAG: HlyD family type I secretion periplasmic adaptor subunit [Gammaproteobacteria bacterium]